MALQLCAEPIIACQAQTVKNLIVFAPTHDRFTSKTAICPHDDSDFAVSALRAIHELYYPSADLKIG
jgi:hypothetical protein